MTQRTAKLPGISTPVTATQPIYAGSNFLWGEATKGLTRLPMTSLNTQKIVKLARYMDDVRTFLGEHPIAVTSWYRPPHINKAIGGASASRHIVGDAVDFYVRGRSLNECYQLLEKYHGDKGGLAIGNGFIHIDLRGHRSRWVY